MLEKLKYIWKEPVFSKVISVGIIAFISLAYNFLVAAVHNTSFKKEFIIFWTKEIQLWHLLLLVFLVSILYLFIKKFKRFKYDAETLKLDRDLFNQIRKSHLTEDMMLAPKNYCFSSTPFLANSLTDLFNISEESRKSDFEFMNPALEKRKQKLIKEIDNLYEITTRYIFGTNNPGYLSIPSEWEFKNPEMMQEAELKISHQEKLLADTYDDLIKTGRRILKV